MGRTVGQVLGGGDGKHTGQTGHLRENVFQSFSQPRPHGGDTGAESGQVAFADTDNIGMRGQKIVRQGARFVKIQIDTDAVSPGSLD